MQRAGRVVAKGWALTPYQVTNVATETQGSGRSRALSAIITTFRVASARAYSCSSAATTSSEADGALSSSEQRESVCEELYFTGTAPATDLLGPFSLRSIPGKGRGCVAQRELRPGELVMAVQPIAVLHGPQDAMPSPDALVDQLRSAWPAMPPAHRDALRQMFVGKPSAATPTSTTAESQPTTSAEPSASAGARSGVSGGSGSRDRDDGGGEVDFRAVVSYNAYGDECEDLPAADLRRSDGGDTPQPPPQPQPRSHVGLWPHFSNLNHGCAPNCVHYVVGSTMVVRAVQVVPEGSELLISYLGREALAPRQVRQGVLQSRYGFSCDCARCRTEEELPEELQALLQQLYDRTRHELAPRFERLAAAAATEAAAQEEGLTSGYDDDAEEEEAEVTEAAAAAPGSVRAGASSGLTAAELAKRALRKGGSPSSALGPQLASLEPRLEECARQLHAAIQELQEDDEAIADHHDGPDPRVGGAASTNTELSPPPAPASPSGLRQLTRVQAAHAAAYQLLELVHLHAELTAAAAAGSAGGGGGVGGRARSAASGALAACWHVLDAISRGSELQVFQACKLLSDALQTTGYGAGVSKRGGSGSSPEPVREAAALLGQSLLARYGRLRGRGLSRMTQAAIRSSRDVF